MKSKKIGEIRQEIDKIDTKLVKLINSRGSLSRRIGEIKRKKTQPVYRPERESEVYSRVIKKNEGPIRDESLIAVYREIMSACISLERPLIIAFLGPEFTFTHLASIKKFGKSVKYLSCDSIPEVFKEVEKANADYGVVPIENSTEGAVNHTLDMFVSSTLIICSEIYLPVSHSLLARGGDIQKVRKIYSHPHVFGQCRGWIEKNVPRVKLCETLSTAKAAEIAGKEAGSACLAGEMAAGKYKLKVLASNVEDENMNITRFLVVGKQASKMSAKDKTSIMFSVKDKPGVLHDMLSSFKNKKINLTKIESRPSKKGLWKYYFFIDLEGHTETPKIKRAIMDLEKKCHFIKILGSYPAGQ
jgi:chorismate mutase/prephenate dehydratase